MRAGLASLALSLEGVNWGLAKASWAHPKTLIPSPHRVHSACEAVGLPWGLDSS